MCDLRRPVVLLQVANNLLYTIKETYCLMCLKGQSVGAVGCRCGSVRDSVPPAGPAWPPTLRGSPTMASRTPASLCQAQADQSKGACLPCLQKSGVSLMG